MFGYHTIGVGESNSSDVDDSMGGEVDSDSVAEDTGSGKEALRDDEEGNVSEFPVESQAGFTVSGALAAVTGACYLVERRLNGKDED